MQTSHGQIREDLISEEEVAALNEILGIIPVESRPTAKFLVSKILDHLMKQLFLAERGRWKSKASGDKFVREIASNFIPIEQLDSKQILGESMKGLIREVNDSFCCDSTTPGARKELDTLAELQGGYFCTICGSDDSLHVDHIKPVNQGGAAHDFRNLQILCKLCNLGKSNFDDNLLPSVVRTTDESEPKPSVRFLKLLISTSIDEKERLRGQCECGEFVGPNVKLKVRRIRESQAANILNLRITCNKCEVL